MMNQVFFIIKHRRFTVDPALMYWSTGGSWTIDRLGAKTFNTINEGEQDIDKLLKIDAARGAQMALQSEWVKQQ